MNFALLERQYKWHRNEKMIRDCTVIHITLKLIGNVLRGSSAHLFAAII